MLAYLTVLYDPDTPQLVGIEEPENHLHPRLLPQLAEECRSASANAQLMVTTHSPFFVNGLDETYPEPSFYPSDRASRLRCRQLEELADTLADNAINLWYQKRKGDKADASDAAKYQAAIDRLLPYLNEQLVSSTYLLGSTLTAADIAAVSAVGYYNLRLGEDWQQQYPHLAEWFKNLHRRESVQSTVPQP